MKNLHCLLGAVTKNAVPCEYKYSSYGIGFDSPSEILFFDRSIGKNVIVFGVNMSSSVHVDNKRKCILILVEGLTQRFYGTASKAEAKYLINFSRPNRKLLMSPLQWNQQFLIC